MAPVAVERTLHDLPPRKLWLPGDPIREVNPRRVTRPEALTRARPVFEARPDPLLPRQLDASRAADRSFTAPGVNVEGQGFGGGFPPDTAGAGGCFTPPPVLEARVFEPGLDQEG